MNISQFNKIIVVTLCESYSKDLGYLLSQNLGVMFCDTKELIEYELVDKKAVQELCSKRYLQESEKKVIKHLADFENVVVAINFDYLIHNLKLLKEGSLIVYVKLSKTFVQKNGNVVDVISFEDRDKKLQEISTICVDVRKTELQFVCNKIIEKIGGLL